MKVYRIETADGKGVCRVMGSKLCALYNLPAGDENEHDGFEGSLECHNHAALLCQHPYNVFGFPSLDRLHEWFPNAQGRALMHAAGAKCMAYEVPTVEASNGYQVIFDKRTSTSVEEVAL
jgi:hypothetical protein